MNMKEYIVNNKKKVRISLGLIIAILFIVFIVNTVGAFSDKDNLVFTGTVEAREIDVRNRIPGRISEVLVTEGQDVVEGDILWKIDPRDLNVKKLQAQAALSGAEAQLQKGINGARQQDIKSAKSLADKAQAKVSLLEKKHSKLVALYEGGGISRDSLDEFETELLASQMDGEAAKQQYLMALEGARSEDILALQAQRDAAAAILEEVNINIDESGVKAPISGSVSMLISNQGELIGTGTPVVTITDYRDAWVEFNAEEDKIGRIKMGDEYSISSKAYPGTEFVGQVISINKNPDFAIKKSTNELNSQDTITYAVRLKIENNDSSEGKILYPGMLTEVSFKGTLAGDEK